jgi:hypothetical protein
MIPRYEDAAARNARIRDTALSGLFAAAALILMVLTTGEKRWGPIYGVTILCGGALGAVLDARRDGWRWRNAGWSFLFTVMAAAIGYGIWWIFFR